MKISTAALLGFLIVMSVAPAALTVHAQGTVQIQLSSTYTLNRYGFAVANETFTFKNNGSSPAQAPGVTVGIGNLSGSIAAFNYTGPGFSVTRLNSISGEFTIGGGANIPANGVSKVSLAILLQNVVTKSNSTFRVLVLATPSLSTRVDVLRNLVQMSGSTQLVTDPPGLHGNVAGANVTYASSKTAVGPQAAVTSDRAVKVVTGTTPDLHVLVVSSSTRTISSGGDGLPVVTDSLQFQNLGPSDLAVLYVSPLTSASGSVTVLPGAGPRLLAATKVTLSNYGIQFTANGPIGNPIPAGTGLTIAYSYSLDSRYYTTSGGQVSINLPMKPLIPDFVNSYTIKTNFPSGIAMTQGSTPTSGGLSPWTGGHVSMAYSLSVGWAANAGIPAASLIFVLLLLGLYASRTTVTEEEETEEESSTEMATAMVTAFDEKTSLINEIWPTIEKEDPNSLDKQYFDTIRGRMDSFKGRALQRLNELKQKSATQRFSELLVQIQTTEREVDRAAKDKLNLYEQFYTKKMRKEVYDRLLPQYTKRLERALNQLSDELHLVQREAKLL